MKDPTKKIYRRSELVKLGYPDKELLAISRSEDAYKVGFHGTLGAGKANKFFFHIDKLDRYLEGREKYR